MKVVVTDVKPIPYHYVYRSFTFKNLYHECQHVILICQHILFFKYLWFI